MTWIFAGAGAGAAFSGGRYMGGMGGAALVFSRASNTMVSTAARTPRSSEKRTSHLLGCTFTSAFSKGMVRCSTHMGNRPMVTRWRQAFSTAEDKRGLFMARPFKKKCSWLRLPRPASPTPTKPESITPFMLPSILVSSFKVSVPYTLIMALSKFPSPALK